MLLQNVVARNSSEATTTNVKKLPLDAILQELPVVRSLSNAIDRLSQSFTESLLGIKVTL